MKNVTFKFLFILFSLFSVQDSKCQLISPDELAELSAHPETSKINAALIGKGYAYSSLQFKNSMNETHDSWYFNPFHRSGEKPNAFVVKITDSTQHIRLQYVLVNPYHYKLFIETLLKEKYKFEGITFSGPNTAHIFRKNKTLLKISTFTNSDGNNSFEISIY